MAFVWQLAASMGGIGFIETHLSECAHDNVLINTHMLEAARVSKVKKYLYTSSACVYAHDKQVDENVTPLKEEDAYPAMPEPGYGWEKLFSEEMCKYYQKDYGMDIKIVRFHNVYGPLGTYDGGKEKSPAALCRKIAKVQKPYEAVEIWGDGLQTRSYMFVDDCIA
jgi:nucleoside-diphosphate-sugar epimerase